jgi:hypothetical protein
VRHCTNGETTRIWEMERAELHQSCQTATRSRSGAIALKQVGGSNTPGCGLALMIGPGSGLTLPMMGFGVFVMVRKQVLGIHGRAEHSLGLASDITVNTPEGVP